MMAKRTKAQDKLHEQGFASGAAVSAAIVYGTFNEDRVAEEILGATGLTTAAKMRRLGVDEYDISILKPLLAYMRKRKLTRPASKRTEEEKR